VEQAVFTLLRTTLQLITHGHISSLDHRRTPFHPISVVPDSDNPAQMEVVVAVLVCTTLVSRAGKAIVLSMKSDCLVFPGVKACRAPVIELEHFWFRLGLEP